MLLQGGPEGGQGGGPEGVKMTIFWSFSTVSARIRVFIALPSRFGVILAKTHFFSGFSSKSWGFGRKTRILVGKTNTNSNFSAESGRCTLGPPPDPLQGGHGGYKTVIFDRFYPLNEKNDSFPNFPYFSGFCVFYDIY